MCVCLSQASAKLYLNLLELEYSGDVQQNEVDILACFDRALSSPLPLDSRLTFSQRKVEFLQDFGSDINKSVHLQNLLSNTMNECFRTSVQISL